VAFRKDLTQVAFDLIDRFHVSQIKTSVSNPGFPVPEPRIFGYSTTETRFFFNDQTWVFEKSWNCCCIQILAILITLKLPIGACNGQRRFAHNLGVYVNFYLFANLIE